jgi:hypothetical protein
MNFTNNGNIFLPEKFLRQEKRGRNYTHNSKCGYTPLYFPGSKNKTLENENS